MQAISGATNLSNWTLALILGSSAALKSGAQQGMEGELPLCDVLLVLMSLRSWWRNVDPSDDNMFIGFDSLWTRMMLRTFQTRRLQYISLILKEDGPTHRDCKCHMVLDPTKAKSGDGTSSSQGASDEHNRKNALRRRPRMFYGLVTEYYGLSHEQTKDAYDSKSPEHFLVVHRASCILKQTVDERMTEFYPDVLTEVLNKQTNENAKDKCKKLIEFMCAQVTGCHKANVWDKDIIERVSNLMPLPDSTPPSVLLKEAMDRIHSRIPEMLGRLNLKSFVVDNVPYTVEDVLCAFTMYFGVMRALQMSRLIYGEKNQNDEPASTPNGNSNSSTLCSEVHGTYGIIEAINVRDKTASENLISIDMRETESSHNDPPPRSKGTDENESQTRGLVFVGYNINVGHELIRDVVEIPTLNGEGYSSVQLIEDTQKERIVVSKVEFSSVFATSIGLDLALAVAIMLLSGIGPIMSMYTARMVTAPYRESYLKMGTSMRWSISEACMLHTGSARDDWMVGIRPVPKARKAIIRFAVMAGLTFIIPIILWCSPLPQWDQFRIDAEGQNHLLPNTTFGQLICILGLIVGSAWVLLSYLNRKTKIASSEDKETQSSEDKETQSSEDKETQSLKFSPGLITHIIINMCLTALPVATVYGAVEANWVYLYLLEGIYFCQWLVGELFGWWVYESTALFMIGVVSAIRLSGISDS